MKMLGSSQSTKRALSWMPVLGGVTVFLAVWFGLLWTGVEFLANPWLRAGVFTTILAVVALAAGRSYQKRRAATRALEKTLIVAPTGDGPVLAARMQEALGKLKEKGGSTYLDDLPWYIIIGPPGAGKTTALLHAGLEFPGTDTASVAGFGGTRTCDFWLTEDAVLIDTAGRYTTQDSDRHADGASWKAFLEQLKTARPKQPINGVILAFSCDDLLTASPDALDAHARTIRKRLEEIYAELHIEVPVYVMFTKADMIAGFREFFGAFDEQRRRRVWGVTFQTKNRKEETYKSASAEFDGLISRLSSEVTNRLNEESDSVARISAFGFPGQMASVQRNVVDFLRRVFQSSQGIHAVLRGFYFTSGTQEGTPIDQVLGTMARGDGYPTQFMSGSGRSYFLQDLLQKVIFAERDWVGHDRWAMRFQTAVRTIATSLIVLVTGLALGLFGFSFWENATLVRQAGQVAKIYQLMVQSNPVLTRTILSDPSPRPVVDALAVVRDIPAGWGDPRQPTLVQHMGLSRHASIRRSALDAYSDALERHLRPRMMLQLETNLRAHIDSQDSVKIYHALKVYFLVAKQQPGGSDDGAVQAYFAKAWQTSDWGADGARGYTEANAHLAAMLALDDRVTPALKPNKGIVDTAQQMIATLPLAQLAYNIIKSEAANLPPFKLADTFGGGQADQVFQTLDNGGLDSLEVPGLYTFSGYWDRFRPALKTAAQRLELDAWVVGEPGLLRDHAGAFAGLNRDIHALYRVDFLRHWDEMLARIKLRPIAAGMPEFTALTVMGIPDTSPLVLLAEAVDRETRLSRFLEEVQDIEQGAEILASGSIPGQSQEMEFSNFERSKRAFQRRQLESTEINFRKWHRFVSRDAAAGARPVDILLARLREVAKTQRSAAAAHGRRAILKQVTENAQPYPNAVVGFVTQLESELLAIWADDTIGHMQEELTDGIAGYCRQTIETTFPFAEGGQHIDLAAFGGFFGYGGRMEAYYQKHLRAHTQRDAQGGLVPREGSLVGARLTPSLLQQFTHAERIRQAFFAAESDRPSVRFTLRQMKGSDDVTGTLVAFGDRQVEISPTSTAIGLSWPDETAEIAFSLLPQKTGEANFVVFDGGGWSMADFIEGNGGQTIGPQVDISHLVGARAGRYRLSFEGLTVPFLMPELRNFQCPQAVE